MLGLATLIVGYHALMLGYLVGILCLLGRRFRDTLRHDGLLSLGLRAACHLLGNLRLADGLVAAFLREHLLTVGYLLHLFAHAAIDIRLFLPNTQLVDLRLQLTDTLTIDMTYVKPCCYR